MNRWRQMMEVAVGAPGRGTPPDPRWADAMGGYVLGWADAGDV